MIWIKEHALNKIPIPSQGSFYEAEAETEFWISKADARPRHR